MTTERKRKWPLSRFGVLSGNPAFPAPVSGDDKNILWNTGDIDTFRSLWSSVQHNGWTISTASLPTFNFTHAAANAPGSTYTPALADPLFDA